MKSNTTFSIIKPDAIKNNCQGLIIDRILKAGFQIVAMKMCSLNEEHARKFYCIHKDKSFFDSLIKFMSSGALIALVLKKEDAVDEFRNLIGATNPEDATKGTIRADFATSIEHNAVHGSDSCENAKHEISFFFSSLDILN
ncbi:MAG: nucleoside-diphosphate kinase [Solitalea-like symbiont of Acarus siro]